MVTWPPPNADCEVIPGAEWLCGPGRPRRVRVWSDDYVEDADEEADEEADERIRVRREPQGLENADDGRPTRLCKRTGPAPTICVRARRIAAVTVGAYRQPPFGGSPLSEQAGLLSSRQRLGME